MRSVSKRVQKLTLDFTRTEGVKESPYLGVIDHELQKYNPDILRSITYTESGFVAISFVSSRVVESPLSHS